MAGWLLILKNSEQRKIILSRQKNMFWEMLDSVGILFNGFIGIATF